MYLIELEFHSIQLETFVICWRNRKKSKVRSIIIQLLILSCKQQIFAYYPFNDWFTVNWSYFFVCFENVRNCYRGLISLTTQRYRDTWKLQCNNSNNKILTRKQKNTEKKLKETNEKIPIIVAVHVYDVIQSYDREV